MLADIIFDRMLVLSCVGVDAGAALGADAGVVAGFRLVALTPGRWEDPAVVDVPRASALAARAFSWSFSSPMAFSTVA